VTQTGTGSGTGAPAATPTATGARAAEAVTPTVRQWLRRTRFWIGLVAALLLVATVWTLANAGLRNADPLASDNPGPSGGMALAEVLRQQGVRVEAADTFAEARAAAADPAGTTILLYDPNLFLDPQRIGRLGELADRLVVLEPTADVLDAYAPGVAFAGSPKDAHDQVAPACDLPAADRAGAVTVGDASLQPVGGGDAATFCYPVDSGGFLLGQAESGASSVTVLPDATQFDNEHVTSDGNAALALNLLGATQNLVWYVPTILDLPASGQQPSLGRLTPGWVTPVLTLLLVVFVAAAVWRGRRLGPLVIENLPVVVPSRETMEGRARLYQRSSARRRALDALRVGAVGRIATSLALARTASVEEVVRAAAAATGRPADEVREVLLEGSPASDADLVRLSDALQRLEDDVRTAADPRAASARPRDPRGTARGTDHRPPAGRMDR
jgi:hypothetical protein